MSQDLRIPRIKKFDPIPHDIIVIDGVWGSGKSLLNPIVSSLSGVQQVRYDSVIEQLCILQTSKKISSEVASTILQSHLGELFYSNLIGRHLNFRWKDHSGLGAAPNKVSRFKEIFREEGDAVLRKGLDSHAALNIMTHNLLPNAATLFDVFENRMKLIELVRHPMGVVDNWNRYQATFEKMRETTLSFDIENSKVPWFVLHRSSEYLASNNLGRSILGIIETYKVLLNEAKNSLGGKNDSVLFIAFEDLELSTDKTLTEICGYLNRERTRYTGKVTRRLGLPRELNSPSFKGDSGRTPLREQSLRELRQLLDESYFEEFHAIIQEYEELFVG
jgi:hypothetical protein